MKCPFCGYGESTVLETRDTENGIRRRRQCLKCGKRFTTYERIEHSPLVVIKKNGIREQFDKEKLRRGIIKACEKRPISIEQINKIIDEIESELYSRGEQEVKSKKIGELVMKKLKKLDKVAYIRFASVYREFRDLEDFEKELKKLSRR
ncbi:transcriptional repressor NrdR [Candidatus Woesearchaeota archaeon]|nr:transcriptional repressor NrdR [Candidatus Woesearchaeota archaeon]